MKRKSRDSYVMKKTIKKHIDKQDFVKVYLSDDNGFSMIHFEGIVFDQSEKFVLMCDFEDFKFDGFVVFRKSDISEIKRSENESFVDSIIEKEGLKSSIIQKAANLDLNLDGFKEIVETLKVIEQPVIIEHLYDSKPRFHIGPITKIKGKKVYVDYINAKGEYDLKPVVSKFKEITYIKFDSLYANLFFKYAKRIM